MSIDPQAKLQKALEQQTCRVRRGEHDWTFSFGDAATIVAAVPWRIIQGDVIAHADQDDFQQFGLPEPVDGEAKANALFDGRLVQGVQLDSITADLRVWFDGATRLDIFNNSSGYEGWQASLQNSDGVMSVVALGGGGVAEF